MNVLKFLFLLLFALLLVAVGITVVSSTQLDAANRQLVEDVWQGAGDSEAATYQPKQLKGLPASVQRYLQKVLTPGMPLVRRLRLQQHGTFNIGNDEPQWLPLKATSHITTTPPGMVWEARLSIAPPLHIRVVDYYLRGRGGLSGTLLGAIPVVDATPAPELDQGELMSWLAEAVWYPSALLPGSGVSWEALDKQSARATIKDGDTSASLDFHFNNDDEVVRVSSEARAREVDGRYQMTPWSCHYRDYAMMSGVLVPREGEVVWHLPQGELPYMRARLDHLDYDPQP
jgi:hypothetical protein